jgi:hypothetical protein
MPPAFVKTIREEILYEYAKLTNKTISKNTYFYTLPSIPSHQGRETPSPLVGEGKGEGVWFYL